MLFQLPLFLSALVLAATVAHANDPTLPMCGLKCATDTPPKSPCIYMMNVTCTCTDAVYAKLFRNCIDNECDNTEDVQAIIDFGLATCKLPNITTDTGGLDGTKKYLPPSTDSHHEIVKSSRGGSNSSASSPPPASSLHAAILICIGLVTIGLANLV